MSESFQALQAQFAAESQKNNNENRPSNYYPFWKMQFGQTATIRFLPDANKSNPWGFLVEKLMHNLEINGERRSVPCNKMWGKTEECPICNVSSGFFKEEGDDSPRGKQYWRKKQHIAQALVVEDPLPPNPETGETWVGKVCYFNLGFQLYSVIKEAITGGIINADPFDYVQGYDFMIKKSEGQGGNPNYSLGSRFLQQSSLEEDIVAFVEDEIIDLSTLIPSRMDEDRMNAMLHASLTGEHYDDGSGGSAAAATTTAPTAAATATPAATQEAAPAATVTEQAAPADDGGYKEKGNDVLEKIRNRKKAQAE
jgi:hypothetical protein